MNTTIIRDRIQEDWPFKRGHCLNPFEPLSWKIKLCKGWRKRYTSFKQFCENAIGKTSSAVNNWIRSAARNELP